MDKNILREKMKPHEELPIVDDPINPLAVYPHKCPKCGFDKAQLISKGIWYSDEDDVVEYVCGRCNAHDRPSEGSKVK